MNYTNDYMNKSYYVEHDDFFKYIREYLQEEKSQIYDNQCVNDIDDTYSDTSSEYDSEEHNSDDYDFY